MALGEHGPRATYFTVADGAIIRRFKDQSDDPQARPVTRKDGTISYQREYKFIEGYVTRIEIGSATVNGKHIEKAQWKVHIEDGPDHYILTMHYNSAYAKRFINCAASVSNWGARIRISPWKMQKTDEKTGTLIADKFWLGVTLYHPPFMKDSKYAPKYTRDEYPEMEKVRLKGVDQWDDEKQMLFWEQVVTEEISPKIESATLDRRIGGQPDAPVAFDPVTAEVYSQPDAELVVAEPESYQDVPF